MVLENHHLYNVLAENLSTAQSILQTAQAIAENPSPQYVVNILRDTLFETHISSCAMLLYGPVREDSPNGPFEYLEIRGSWSKRHGSGIGIGVRLYLKDYPDLLEQLETQEILTFASCQPDQEPLRPADSRLPESRAPALADADRAAIVAAAAGRAGDWH